MFVRFRLTFDGFAISNKWHPKEASVFAGGSKAILFVKTNSPFQRLSCVESDYLDIPFPRAVRNAPLGAGLANCSGKMWLLQTFPFCPNPESGRYCSVYISL